MSGTDLTRAALWDTLFVDVNLAGVSGLESCTHAGPSALDHRTLRHSGKLPLAFLRGCGLSDLFIDHVPSLFGGSSIQFYSCFISYSTKNQDFSSRLHADLQKRGVRCWFAPHDVLGGRKLHDQIDEAIRVYDRLLLILSPDSMASAWVEREIGRAYEKERALNRRVFFPISLVPFQELRAWSLFDPDSGVDLAKKVLEYHVPNFKAWRDPDAYQPEFEKLMNALKAEDAGKTA